MRKSIILMGLVAVLLGALFTGCQSVKKMEKQEYALGRTQGSGVAAFFDQGLLYKDNIKSGDELQFKGLYWTDFKGEPKLLSEKYEASVNYYDNAVYFIDDESHIQKVDLKDNKAETVVKSNVSSILIIDDIMYYIQQMGEHMHSLFGLELKTRKVKELASGVDMEYLYDCWGFAGVIIQEKDQLAICSYAGGIEQKQDILENKSLVGFLPDRSIIYSEAADEGDEIGIYCKKDFTDTNPKLLIEKENIHHIILHKDEMVFTVLNQNGPIEVYQYDFQTEKCNKIGNTNYDISDFNEEYVVSCYDDAIGVVDLIERKTGKCIPMSDQ